jgi:hypothetical protein
MQEAIKLDFLFDSMNYAVEKGFPWNKVAFVVKFADKLTEELQSRLIHIFYNLYLIKKNYFQEK